MGNPWLAHLAAYRKAHPGESLKSAMKKASSSYSKKGSAKKVSKKTTKGKRKKKKLVKFEKHEGGAIREGDRVKLMEQPVVPMPDPIDRSVHPYENRFLPNITPK